ncbi:MAG: trigger factor [Chthoniobacterales bacterium]
MNVQVETKPNCTAILHVELPSNRVEKEWAAVAKDFQRQARIPGYRPGKAPNAIVETRFAKEIKEELTRKLVSDVLREAIREKNLRVLNIEGVNHVDIADDKSMRFSATVTTSPEFTLPEYSKLEVEVAKRQVSPEDVEKTLQNLREQYADFQDVEGRSVKWDDFIVISYTGAIDGKPLEEVHPDVPRPLRAARNFWLRMAPETTIKGFCEALEGANVDETRKFQIEIPADFGMQPLQGAKIDYEVQVHGIKNRILPELDDAFASRIIPEKSLADIRQQIETEMSLSAEREYEDAKRNGALKQLLANIDCELPAQMLRNEMESILGDIVRENQVRGVAEDEIRKHQQELVGVANQTARDRLRSTFFLLRVAEKENLKVAEEELIQQISGMATRYKVTFDKMVKDLRKRNAISLIQEQILCRKALDLIASNVTVLEPKNAPAPAGAA